MRRQFASYWDCVMSDRSSGTAGVVAGRRRKPKVKLLSRPDSPYLEAIRPDDRIGQAGRALTLLGYDANRPPPALPDGAKGAEMRQLSAEDINAGVRSQYGNAGKIERLGYIKGVRGILAMLSSYPGDTWEERWLASGCDAAPRTWIEQHGLLEYRGWSPSRMGMNFLLANRVLRPSYNFILDSRARLNLRQFLAANGGEPLNRLHALPAYQRTIPKRQNDADAALARVLIRTGKEIEQINGDDLLHYADVVKTSGRNRREHLLWELLVELGPLAEEAPTLRATWSARGNTRQHSTASLVDRYGIPASGMRDLLIDYLEEVRPGMDYGSVESLAYRLVRLFWWEVLQINPTQVDLSLTRDVATTWRERLALTTTGAPRRETHSTLLAVRAFYRDLAEWSHEEPARWGPWVAPCPVPREISRAAAKETHRRRNSMQERTRILTPLLSVLVDAALKQKQRSDTFLRLAVKARHGEEFVVDGLTFVRDSPPEACQAMRRARTWARLAVGQQRPKWIRGQGQRIDVYALEEDGFWAWAVIETFRHTGVRLEELLELTQLSLRHYTHPTTGTLVPLLHIVPSKTDCERLIPMSPELVQVLLEVMRRAKGGNDTVPLSIRYDYNERTYGQPFPHLFGRMVGARQEVLSAHYLREILLHTAAIAELTDVGERIHFTPHDFRRLFATDALSTGLPLHIIASLMGHLNLDTTRGYTAVFPEHLIAAHHAFIERRRLLRPFDDLRPAHDDEWADFEDHFLKRRVALGDCHRPYGTPCVHEHACTRCRFLRVDPAQLGRIEEMTHNADNRLTEAKDKGWLGEVAALEENLKHLRIRADEARRRLTTDEIPLASEGTLN